VRLFNIWLQLYTGVTEPMERYRSTVGRVAEAVFNNEFDQALRSIQSAMIDTIHPDVELQEGELLLLIQAEEAIINNDRETALSLLSDWGELTGGVAPVVDEVEVETVDLTSQFVRLVDLDADQSSRVSNLMSRLQEFYDANPSSALSEFRSLVEEQEMSGELTPELADDLIVLSEQFVVLFEMGLGQSVEELMDFSALYSRVDGMLLRTPDERQAYLSHLLQLSGLELQWYQGKPDAPPLAYREYPEDSPENQEYKRAYNDIKNYNAAFISEHLIPMLLEEGYSFSELPSILHSWQVRGTDVQSDFITWALSQDDIGIDISTQYRTLDIQVGELGDEVFYQAPIAEDVSNLMELFFVNLESFQRELDQSRGLVSEEEFTQRVLTFAAYAQQRFVDIHPMFDGNGRTSRMLFEYIVASNLGIDSPYRTLPMELNDQGEPTIHSFLNNINSQYQRTHYSTTSATGSSQALREKIEAESFEDMLGDELLDEYVGFIVESMEETQSIQPVETLASFEQEFTEPITQAIEQEDTQTLEVLVGRLEAEIDTLARVGRTLAEPVAELQRIKEHVPRTVMGTIDSILGKNPHDERISEYIGPINAPQQGRAFVSHSHSSDFSDGAYSVDEIVDRARDEGLAALSITDHNSIGVYELQGEETDEYRLLGGSSVYYYHEDTGHLYYLEDGEYVDTGILLQPGVELGASMPHIIPSYGYHMLFYFKDIASLKEFYAENSKLGEFSYMDTHVVENDGLTLTRSAKKHGGAVFAAHPEWIGNIVGSRFKRDPQAVQLLEEIDGFEIINGVNLLEAQNSRAIDWVTANAPGKVIISGADMHSGPFTAFSDFHDEQPMNKDNLFSALLRKDPEGKNILVPKGKTTTLSAMAAQFLQVLEYKILNTLFNIPKLWNVYGFPWLASELLIRGTVATVLTPFAALFVPGATSSSLVIASQFQRLRNGFRTTGVLEDVTEVSIDGNTGTYLIEGSEYVVSFDNKPLLRGERIRKVERVIRNVKVGISSEQAASDYGVIVEPALVFGGVVDEEVGEVVTVDDGIDFTYEARIKEVKEAMNVLEGAPMQTFYRDDMESLETLMTEIENDYPDDEQVAELRERYEGIQGLAEMYGITEKVVEEVDVVGVAEVDVGIDEVVDEDVATVDEPIVIEDQVEILTQPQTWLQRFVQSEYGRLLTPIIGISGLASLREGSPSAGLVSTIQAFSQLIFYVANPVSALTSVVVTNWYDKLLEAFPNEVKIGSIDLIEELKLIDEYVTPRLVEFNQNYPTLSAVLIPPILGNYAFGKARDGSETSLKYAPLALVIFGLKLTSGGLGFVSIAVAATQPVIVGIYERVFEERTVDESIQVDELVGQQPTITTVQSPLLARIMNWFSDLSYAIALRIPFIDLGVGELEQRNVELRQRLEQLEAQRGVTTVVVSDIHGEASRLEEILDAHSGARVRILGDLMDRGINFREALGLIKQKVESGEAILQHGNHEAKTISAVRGDMRDFAWWLVRDNGADVLTQYGITAPSYDREADPETYGIVSRFTQEVFFASPDQVDAIVERYLAEYPGQIQPILDAFEQTTTNAELLEDVDWIQQNAILYQIEDGDLLSHAGIPVVDGVPRIEYKGQVYEGQRVFEAMDQMQADIRSGEMDMHFLAWDQNSPLWSDNPFKRLGESFWLANVGDRKTLESVLSQLGVNRIVFGHVPTELLLEYYPWLTKVQDLVIPIDGGMTDHYGGQGVALVIDNGGYGVYDRESSTSTPIKALQQPLDAQIRAIENEIEDNEKLIEDRKTRSTDYLTRKKDNLVGNVESVVLTNSLTKMGKAISQLTALREEVVDSPMTDEDIAAFTEEIDAMLEVLRGTILARTVSGQGPTLLEIISELEPTTRLSTEQAHQLNADIGLAIANLGKISNREIEIVSEAYRQELLAKGLVDRTSDRNNPLSKVEKIKDYREEITRDTSLFGYLQDLHSVSREQGSQVVILGTDGIDYLIPAYNQLTGEQATGHYISRRTLATKSELEQLLAMASASEPMSKLMRASEGNIGYYQVMDTLIRSSSTSAREHTVEDERAEVFNSKLAERFSDFVMSDNTHKQKVVDLVETFIQDADLTQPVTVVDFAGTVHAQTFTLREAVRWLSNPNNWDQLTPEQQIQLGGNQELFKSADVNIFVGITNSFETKLDENPLEAIGIEGVYLLETYHDAVERYDFVGVDDKSLITEQGPEFTLAPPTVQGLTLRRRIMISQEVDKLKAKQNIAEDPSVLDESAIAAKVETEVSGEVEQSFLVDQRGFSTIDTALGLAALSGIGLIAGALLGPLSFMFLPVGFMFTIAPILSPSIRERIPFLDRFVPVEPEEVDVSVVDTIGSVVEEVVVKEVTEDEDVVAELVVQTSDDPYLQLLYDLRRTRDMMENNAPEITFSGGHSLDRYISLVESGVLEFGEHYTSVSINGMDYRIYFLQSQGYDNQMYISGFRIFLNMGEIDSSDGEFFETLTSVTDSLYIQVEDREGTKIEPVVLEEESEASITDVDEAAPLSLETGEVSVELPVQGLVGAEQLGPLEEPVFVDYREAQEMTDQASTNLFLQSLPLLEDAVARGDDNTILTILESLANIAPKVDPTLISMTIPYLVDALGVVEDEVTLNSVASLIANVAEYSTTPELLEDLIVPLVNAYGLVHDGDKPSITMALAAVVVAVDNLPIPELVIIDILIADLKQNENALVISALGKIGESAIEPLIEALKETNGGTFAQDLGEIAKTTNSELIQQLVDSLITDLKETSDYNEAKKLISILGKIAGPAIEPMISLLGQMPDEVLEVKLAQTIGRIGEPAIEPLLAALGETNDIDVISGIGSALSKITGTLMDVELLEPMIEPLATALVKANEQNNDDARYSIVSTLNKIAKQVNPELLRPALEPVADLLETSGVKDVRLMAIVFLREVAEPAIPTLYSRLKQARASGNLELQENIILSFTGMEDFSLVELTDLIKADNEQTKQVLEQLESQGYEFRLQDYGILTSYPEVLLGIPLERDELIAAIREMMPAEHIEKTVQPGYESQNFDDYVGEGSVNQLSIVSLAKLYLMLNTLSNPSFVDRVGLLIIQDFLNTDTETGGVVRLVDGSVALVNFEPSKRGNYKVFASPTEVKVLSFYEVGDYHLHAGTGTTKGNADLAGPSGFLHGSEGDLVVAHLAKRDGVVITHLGGEHGRNSYNVVFYTPTGQVVDLGVYRWNEESVPWLTAEEEVEVKAGMEERRQLATQVVQAALGARVQAMQAAETDVETNLGEFLEANGLEDTCSDCILLIGQVRQLIKDGKLDEARALIDREINALVQGAGSSFVDIANADYARAITELNGLIYLVERDASASIDLLSSIGQLTYQIELVQAKQERLAAIEDGDLIEPWDFVDEVYEDSVSNYMVELQDYYMSKVMVALEGIIPAEFIEISLSHGLKPQDIIRFFLDDYVTDDNLDQISVLGNALEEYAIAAETNPDLSMTAEEARALKDFVLAATSFFIEGTVKIGEDETVVEGQQLSFLSRYGRAVASVAAGVLTLAIAKPVFAATTIIASGTVMPALGIAGGAIAAIIGGYFAYTKVIKPWWLRRNIDSQLEVLATSDDQNEIDTAVQNLVIIGEPAIEPLMTYMEKSFFRDKIFAQAIVEVSNNVGPEVMETFIPRLIEDSLKISPDASFEIGEVFSKIGEPAIQLLVETLESATQRKDYSAKERIVNTFSQIAKTNDPALLWPAIKPLIDSMQAEPFLQNTGTRNLLTTIGAPTMPYLVEALSYTEGDVKKYVIMTIKSIAEKEDVTGEELEQAILPLAESFSTEDTWTTVEVELGLEISKALTEIAKKSDSELFLYTIAPLSNALRIGDSFSKVEAARAVAEIAKKENIDGNSLMPTVYSLMDSFGGLRKHEDKIVVAAAIAEVAKKVDGELFVETVDSLVYMLAIDLRVQNDEREIISDALAAIGVPAIIPLLNSLGDKEARSTEITNTIAKMGDSAIQPIVDSLPELKYEQSVSRAADILAEFGEKAIPGLVEVLQKAEGLQINNILWSITKIAGKEDVSRRALEPLIQPLIDLLMGSFTPALVHSTFGDIGPSTVQPLFEALQATEDHETKRKILFSLSYAIKNVDPEIAEPLIQPMFEIMMEGITGEGVSKISSDAMEVLINMGKTSVPFLLQELEKTKPWSELVEGSKEWMVKKQISGALIKIAQEIMESDLEFVMGSIMDMYVELAFEVGMIADASIQSEIIRSASSFIYILNKNNALTRMDQDYLKQKIIVPFISLLKEQDTFIDHDASFVLKMLGLPALETILTDKDISLDDKKKAFNLLKDTLPAADQFFYELIFELESEDQIGIARRIYTKGIMPTNYLVDNYEEGIEDEWEATLTSIQTRETSMDYDNPLHVALMYTDFRGKIDCCFSRPSKYNYETYQSIMQDLDADAVPSLSGDQEAELVYAGYEAYRVHQYLVELNEMAKQMGRKLLVVPNYSYGRFIIEPIQKDLERLDNIIIQPARIGSTEAHSNDYLLHASNTNRLFDENTERMILEEQPIIVMVDGSNSYTRGRDARYPDAQKGFTNWGIVLNDVLGVEQGEMQRTDDHITGLRETSAYATLRTRMEGYGISVEGAEQYNVHYWNPAGTSLALTKGKHATRVVETKVPVTQSSEIDGPAVVIINSVFNDGYDDVSLPADVKAKGNNKQHESAYYDDTHHIQDILFKKGSHGIEIQDEIYEAIRDEFTDFKHQNSPLYVAIEETGILTHKQATEMRLHRLQHYSVERATSKLLGKLSRREITLSAGQIADLIAIIQTQQIYADREVSSSEVARDIAEEEVREAAETYLRDPVVIEYGTSCRSACVIGAELDERVIGVEEGRHEDLGPVVASDGYGLSVAAEIIDNLDDPANDGNEQALVDYAFRLLDQVDGEAQEEAFARAQFLQEIKELEAEVAEESETYEDTVSSDMVDLQEFHISKVMVALEEIIPVEVIDEFFSLDVSLQEIFDYYLSAYVTEDNLDQLIELEELEFIGRLREAILVDDLELRLEDSTEVNIIGAEQEISELERTLEREFFSFDGISAELASRIVAVDPELTPRVISGEYTDVVEVIDSSVRHTINVDIRARDRIPLFVIDRLRAGRSISLHQGTSAESIVQLRKEGFTQFNSLSQWRPKLWVATNEDGALTYFFADIYSESRLNDVQALLKLLDVPSSNVDTYDYGHEYVGEIREALEGIPDENKPDVLIMGDQTAFMQGYLRDGYIASTLATNLQELVQSQLAEGKPIVEALQSYFSVEGEWFDNYYNEIVSTNSMRNVLREHFVEVGRARELGSVMAQIKERGFIDSDFLDELDVPREAQAEILNAEYYISKDGFYESQIQSLVNDLIDLFVSNPNYDALLGSNPKDLLRDRALAAEFTKAYEEVVKVLDKHNLFRRFNTLQMPQTFLEKYETPFIVMYGFKILTSSGEVKNIILTPNPYGDLGGDVVDAALQYSEDHDLEEILFIGTGGAIASEGLEVHDIYFPESVDVEIGYLKVPNAMATRYKRGELQTKYSEVHFTRHASIDTVLEETYPFVEALQEDGIETLDVEINTIVASYRLYLGFVSHELSKFLTEHQSKAIDNHLQNGESIDRTFLEELGISEREVQDRVLSITDKVPNLSIVQHVSDLPLVPGLTLDELGFGTSLGLQRDKYSNLILEHLDVVAVEP